MFGDWEEVMSYSWFPKTHFKSHFQDDHLLDNFIFHQTSLLLPVLRKPSSDIFVTFVPLDVCKPIIVLKKSG